MFVALLIQYAERIRRIILSSMVFWLYHIFPHYLINGTIFWKKIMEHKMFILISSTNLSAILILRVQRDIIINVPSVRVSYMLFL